VPAYVSLIAEGSLDEAYAVIRSANPFPSVCGRVCTAYCESHCRRSQVDAPVSIRLLKRAATDFRTGPWKPAMDPRRGQKVAVVGAGPAGLTAAHDLAIKGYDVDVFEKTEIAGGMMALGIPDYRLPKDILQQEIQDILDLGVTLKTGVTFGQDVTVDSLTADGYDAIFLGVGCHLGMALDCPGSDAPGVLDAVEFLRDLALNRQPRLGRKVAVIGGGDTAIDSARSALRLGADEVHIVYRRTREEMPAHPAEIEGAVEEGIIFHFLAAPREVVVTNGVVSGLVCQRMRLGDFDRSGRRRPVPIEGADFLLDVDTVIPAIGQRVEPGCVCVETAGGKLCVDPVSLATSQANVFAGGDCIYGDMTVVDAIADGHRAAKAIHSFLSGESFPTPRRRPKTKVGADVMARLEETADQERPPAECPVIADTYRRSGFAEIELGFSVPVACREAARCLRCDFELVEDES
jgi:NADH-quinone oxidoreductase subunit F